MYGNLNDLYLKFCTNLKKNLINLKLYEIVKSRTIFQLDMNYLQNKKRTKF